MKLQTISFLATAAVASCKPISTTSETVMGPYLLHIVGSYSNGSVIEDAYVCTDHTGAAQEGMGVCTVDESTAKADSTVYGVYFNVTTSTTAAGPMWWALPVGSETVESETVESPLEIVARDNNAVSLPLFSTRSSSDHFGFDANGVVYYYNATLDADVYNWVLCNALDYGSYTYTAIGWAPTADKGGCSSVNLTVVDI